MKAQEYLARRLQDLTSRRRADLRPNQRELARALDVAPGSITNWLKGDRRISLDDAERLAEALEVPLSQLVDEHVIDMTPDEIKFLHFVRSLNLDTAGLERLKRILAEMFGAQTTTTRPSPRAVRTKHGS